MALSEETGGNGFYMPVAPAYGVGGSGAGAGNAFGGDWAWIILLLLLGWGNNGWGNRGGIGGHAGGDALYPWMNQADLTTSGFQTAALNDNVTSIRDGIAGLSTQMCNGFAGTNAAITGAQNAIAAQMYGNTIADLERSFASQTAITGGLNNISAQLAQCCCDNRAATQDVKYTIANEACATRANSTANTQAILDKLCQLELDGYKRENDQLRSQLQFANMQASQVAQTAEIRTNNATVANQLVAELRSCPIPAQPVYGNTPIFSCGGGTTCGCGVA